MLGKLSVLDMISKVVRENVFCHAKEGGEGYSKKESCACYNTKEHCCQAIKDRDLFHSLFNGLSMEEIAMNRDKILEENKHLFIESQWFKDNVK